MIARLGSHFYRCIIKPLMLHLENSRLLSPWGWLIGFLLLALLLTWVDETVGWKETLSVWSKMPPSAIVMAAFLFIFSHIVRAYRIFVYSKRAFLGRYFISLKTSSFHQLANNLLPMRMGEAAYPFFMKRYTGTGWAEGAVRLIFLRLLDACVAGSIFLFVLLTLLLSNPWLSLLLCGVFTFVMFYFLVVWAFPSIATREHPKWVSFLKDRWKILGVLSEKLQIACCQSKKENLRLILWTWVAWGAKLLAYGVLLVSMTDLTPVVSLTAAFSGELSSLLPIHGIAGAGTFESAFVIGAMAQGEGVVSAMVAAVNIHLFVLIVSVLMAVISICIPISGIGIDDKK